MKKFLNARLMAAAAGVVITAFPAFLAAQTQPATEFARPPVETVALMLPDAPVPQGGTQMTAPAPGPASSSPAAPAPASSSSQDASPAPSPASPPAATDPAQNSRQEAERELKAEEKQRLLGVMPQFQVVMNGHAAPLTGGEKWRLALHSAVDPFYIAWAFVIGGGYGEVVDSNSGYGWGPPGYFKRVGATYADNVNGALIGNALLPQLLHQDPRYFRKGTGSIKSRFLYAALSTFICHGDNGKKQANVSNVLGNYVSGAISNAYYPANERGVALTLENGTSVTLFGALGGQLLEFGPDISRLLQRHKSRPSAPTAPTASTPVAPAP